MTRDRLDQIRDLCRDDAAFEVLKALVPSIETPAEETPAEEKPANEKPAAIGANGVQPPEPCCSPEVSSRRQTALLRVVARIHDSLDLQTIFQTTAIEIRQFLSASRVGVFRFRPDSNWTAGEFVSEDVSPDYRSAVQVPVEDHCFGEQFAVRYRNGRVQAVENIHGAGLSPCHKAILEQFQVRANLVVPLLRNDQLWGLFCIHQCDRPRQWRAWEIEFVQQIGAQLNVALMQAELVQQIKHQADRHQALFRIITTLHHCSDIDAVFRVAVTEMRSLLNADRVGVFRFFPHSHWDAGEFIAESVAAGYPSALETPVQDKCFGSKFADYYQQGQVQALSDIYAAGLQDCHIQILAQFCIRANLIVPLLQDGYLWGLLCIHQCDRPRQWHSQDIELAQHVATHLDVALQQADLINRTRQQAAELVNTLDNLKEAQSQLVQSEKMSSLGQLVAGIAHEINNPVNFIYGNLTYLDDYTHHLLEVMQCYETCCPDSFRQQTARLSEDVDLDFLKEDLPKTMGSIQVGAERIRDIVSSLQRFARSDDSSIDTANLHDGIDNTLMILQHRLRANANGPEISLVKQYGDLPLVECQANQINQVFMNVFANAVEALEAQYQHHTTGVLRSGLNGSGRQARQLATAARGEIQIVTSYDDNVVIRIIDNGPGLSKDVKARLFDPFFTTKPAGKGTGLGLSISHKIIASHHGTLKYYSTPGRGTECRITLPVQQPKT